MKKAKRWRYYCEYCKKSGGSKYHMENHERGCTNNPNRVCKMCGYLEDEVSPNLQDLIKIVDDSLEWEIVRWRCPWCEFKEGKTEKSVIADLKKITKCPACILAALRQSESTFMFSRSFDYKAEKEAFWRDVNDARLQELPYYSYYSGG